MTQTIEHFVVAVRVGENIFGTGFLIAPDIVVTCAHVIKTVKENYRKKKVDIYFSAESRIVEGYIDDNNYHVHNDVAIVRLVQPLAKCKPAELGETIELTGKEFWSIGYRQLGRYEGVSAIGKIMHPVLDIKPTKNNPNPPDQPVFLLSSKHIRYGMSGAPVYVPEINQVVGMITAFWKSTEHPEPETCFAISVKAITQACNEVSLHPPGQKVLEPFIFSEPIVNPDILELNEACEDYVLVNARIGFVRDEIEKRIDNRLVLKKLKIERKALFNKIERLKKIVKDTNETSPSIDDLMKKLYAWKDIHHKLQGVFDVLPPLTSTLDSIQNRIEDSKLKWNPFKKKQISPILIKNLYLHWTNCRKKLTQSQSTISKANYLFFDELINYHKEIEIFINKIDPIIKSTSLPVEEVDDLNDSITNMRVEVELIFTWVDEQIIKLIEKIQHHWIRQKGG